MFAILSRGRQLCLDIDTQMHLFDSVITPILLYGCEVWGFSDLKLIERVQLRFSKLIMKVKKSTPTVMIQGELGMYPLQTKVKNQMISYWTKLITGEHARYICQMYNLLLLLDCSKWLGAIQATLDNAGLSYVWSIQGQGINSLWLKRTIKQNVKDQFVQEWQNSVFNSSKCSNYRIFKTEFKFENYLVDLPTKLRINYSLQKP